MTVPAINPAFDRWPQEANLIGRIMAGFGELEFSICQNAANATGHYDQTMKALFRVQSTRARLEAGDALARPEYEKRRLGEIYDIAFNMTKSCHQLRNQYAHCNWGDDSKEGLFFTNLQRAAESEGPLFLFWRHIDVPLLQKQLDYLGHTMQWLWWVEFKLAVRRSKKRPYPWPRPQEPTLPSFHNPSEKHTPPWLTPSRRAQHLERALAEKGRPPRQTRKHLAMEARRVAKRTKREANRVRSLSGEKKRGDP